MENFGKNVGVPWLSDTEGALCFICKEVRIMSVTFSLNAWLSEISLNLSGPI